MRDKILPVLLILSILGNIYLVFLVLPAQKNLQELQRAAYLEGSLNSTLTGLQGLAELQALAVMQRIEYIKTILSSGSR